MKQCNITDTLSEIPIDPKVQIHNLYSNRQASIKSIESNLLLYRGDDEKIIQLIQEELDETNSLMILGHNPTISKIAMDLVATSNGSYDNSIPHTMTTASIVVLEFPNLQKWEDLRPGTGIMRHIYTPQT
jgi:phosphohistidine phosphatase SixA